MEKSDILVSIIIPSFNEEGFIGLALDSLLAGSFPHQKQEIIVVDGMSMDGTRDIVQGYVEKYPFVRLLDNPKQFQVYALNIGIRTARGSIIIRCDAHCVFPPQFVDQLVHHHGTSFADNFGGCVISIPFNKTPKALAIARAYNSRAGVGISHRTTTGEEPMLVDTVPFGSWKRTLFDEVGLFDESFIRTQDFEHNYRMRQMGKKVAVLPFVQTQYFCRETFVKLWKMGYQYGYWKNLVNKKYSTISSIRQLIPLVFVLMFIASATIPIFSSSMALVSVMFFGGYFFILVSAAITNCGFRDFRTVFMFVWACLTMHFSYGLGYLEGFLRIFVFGTHGELFKLTYHTR
jgi:glycosyltransferase involved in cell wall biosynthesis